MVLQLFNPPKTVESLLFLSTLGLPTRSLREYFTLYVFVMTHLF